MISEEAKLELLTHLRRSHGRDDAQADAAPAQDHAAPQVAVGVEAREPAGPRAHRQRRSAQQAHLRQARGARGAGARTSRRRSTSSARAEEQAKAALEREENERRETERLDRERLEEENRRRSRRGNAQAHRRGGGPTRAAEPQAREQAERDRKAASGQAGQGPPGQEVDDKATRYGRQELHIAGDVSRATRRRSPRDGRRGAPSAAMPTPSTVSRCRPSRVVREIAVGEAMTVAELAQKMAVKAHRSHQGA